MASAKFSASSLLADLSPGVNASHCIKPQIVKPPPGSVLAPIVPTASSANDSDSASGAKIASVTLSDCLTCSGCVTTAEDLLAGADSAALLEKALTRAKEEDGEKVVVILSQQSVASIAVRLDMGLDVCARVLCGELKSRGVTKVYDGALGNIIALRESAAEVERKRKHGMGNRLEKTGGPILGSMCPAVAIYIEKTQSDGIVKLLSEVKSAQGIMGELVGPSVFAVAAMPCHDRKLEAARLKGEGIDLVMTTEELVRFVGGEDSLRERQFLPGIFDSIANGIHARPFGASVASGSGGYAEFVLRQLSGIGEGKVVEWKNADRGGSLKEAEANGIKVARAYGFKAISRVLRKIKSNKCSYAYVEAMSCPGGCNNGGGQLKGEGRDTNKQILQRTEILFSDGYADPTQDTEESRAAYNVRVVEHPAKTQAQKLFHTAFKKRRAVDEEQVDLSW